MMMMMMMIAISSVIERVSR